MDRKSIIIIGACIVAIFVWMGVIVPKFYPHPPQPAGTNAVSPATNGARAGSNATAISSPAETPTSGAAKTSSARTTIATNVPEEILVVTNENARFIFTSRGGGIQAIELVRYPEKITRQSKKTPLTNNVATLNDHAPAPVLVITGDDSLQDDGNFTLTRTASGVRAEKQLASGLNLIKEFTPGSNYLIHVAVRMENTSTQALKLPAQEWVIGTATPLGPDDNEMNVGVTWYDGAKKDDAAKPWFDNRGFLFFKGTPRGEYRAGVSNVVWAGVQNQFFALLAMPGKPAEQLVARPQGLPKPSAEELPENLRNAPAPVGFQTALVYPAVTLEPGKSIEREINFFAGPKEYRTLARIADRFHNDLDKVMGFGWFGWFSKGLLLAMNWLHFTFSLSYGWAIIAITVIIKMLFWPLTAASTRSMKRMAALQPQMKALQEKYKDDPAKMNKKLMEFMRENKVSPLGGCLPMMLQMPVFFGFFSMIRSAIELRGASFLWVTDLSKPDTLFLIPGTAIPFNLLPLCMGVTMFFQARMTPPSPGVDPTQAKIMKYMPLMFMVFLYNYSAGLALYWTVQNLLTIVQTKLTKTTDVAGPGAPTTSPALTPVSKKKK
ncbi:MAG: membrane protein insertase YidC [Verrucomicrobia bacterium]|nr:MAG: membrane protein insertase YidC [Verrucomicrobiota bacterium]